MEEDMEEDMEEEMEEDTHAQLAPKHGINTKFL